MSSFKIDLATLPKGMSTLVLEGTAAEVDLPEGEWPEPIRGEWVAETNGEVLHLRGTLEATAALECVRCLKSFRLPLVVPFQLFADRGGSRKGDEEALERDAYMRFHDGRQLDVSADVHDALLLEVPMAPHCREECRGLCPRCGADLNDGPCACEQEASAVARSGKE
jgi:uncharacterized protein